MGRRGGFKVWQGIMALLVLAVGLVLFDTLAVRENDNSQIPTGSSDRIPTADIEFAPADLAPAPARTIAVLPFPASSNGPDDEYFADGLSTDIINTLAQVADLRVTARTSAFHFKGKDLSAGEIADRLGVSYVLEGTVLRAGERLEVNVRLIRAEDGFQLWAERYQRRARDTFAIRTDVAEKVADALNIPLDERQREAIEHAGTRNADALIAFQKGIERYERAQLQPNRISLLRQANVEFEHAIEVEPAMAQAYRRHADLMSHVLISQAAGELDGEITGADIARAPDSLARDYSQAIRYSKSAGQRSASELDMALTMGRWNGLGPFSLEVLALSVCEAAEWLHLLNGLSTNAELFAQAFNRMVRCDPMRALTTVHAGNAWLWQKEAGQAENAIHRALDRGLDHPQLSRTLAMALAAQGRFEAAQTVVSRQMRSTPEQWLARGIIAALNENEPAASAALERYLSTVGPNDRASLVLHAAMGHRNAANRLAAGIDARPFGHLVLLQAIYHCMCGAPFDLDAAPVFSAMLADSGLSWPPARPIGFPLKDW